MRTSSQILRFFILSGVIAVNAPANGAMMIDNYSSATNDRFQTSDDPDQFFLSSFSLTGVGQDSTGRWATLIGPNTIISANHFKPSGTISFYAGNDPLTAAKYELGLSGDSKRIGNSDLWIARLSEFAPSGLTVYDIATENISPNNSPVNRASFSFRDEQTLMTGRSPSTFPNDQDQAYGTNLAFDYVERTVDGLGDTKAIQMNYDTNTSETPYESFFRSGDSGAPLFFDDGSGELLLLGINSYTTSDQITGDPVASFSSYTGNDSEEINAQVATWAAIPEPSVSLLMTLALTGFACRRTRT